jgi:hypothetical protein
MELSVPAESVARTPRISFLYICEKLLYVLDGCIDTQLVSPRKNTPVRHAEGIYCRGCVLRHSNAIAAAPLRRHHVGDFI